MSNKRRSNAELQKLNVRGKEFIRYVHNFDKQLENLSDYDREKAEIQWERFLSHEAACLSRYLGRNVEPYQFTALLSFQISMKTWTQFINSTVMGYFKQGKYGFIPTEMLKYLKDNNDEYTEYIDWRRKCESALFEGVYPLSMSTNTEEENYYSSMAMKAGI